MSCSMSKMNREILLQVARGAIGTEEAAELLQIRESEVMMYVLDEGFLSIESLIGFSDSVPSSDHKRLKMSR